MAGLVVRRRAALLSIMLFALIAGPAAAAEPKPGRAKRTRLLRFGKVNIIDGSLFDLAEFYMKEGRIDEGVALLERVVRETPEREARSMAHFNLATIHETILDDPDRARAEYARVTGPWGVAAREKVLKPLRAQKRWVEAADFLRECLAASDDPSEKANVVRALTAVAKTSGDEKLLEATLRSVPDLITYEEARAAAEADREKYKEMQKRAETFRASRPRGPVVGRRPAPLERAPRPVRKPKNAGGAARARPVKSAAEVEAQIRELERAGFNDEARRLREELRKFKDGEDPDQF